VLNFDCVIKSLVLFNLRNYRKSILSSMAVHFSSLWSGLIKWTLLKNLALAVS